MLRKLFFLVIEERIKRGHEFENSLIEIEVVEVDSTEDFIEPDEDALTAWHRRISND